MILGQATCVRTFIVYGRLSLKRPFGRKNLKLQNKPRRCRTMKNQNASEKGVLAKYHVIPLAKLALFIGLLYALYVVYSGMLQLVQLLKTMMVGWAVMLEVLVNSNLLTDVEQLNDTIRWLMDMNGDVVPSLFFQ